MSFNVRNKVTGELSSITTYDPVTGNITGLNPIGNTNLGSNANVAIAGGTSGQVLTTDGAGNLSWSTVGAGSLANGTSSVTIPVADGNVNTTVGGVANVLVVTATGANVTGTVSAGNLNVSGLSNLGPVGNVTITGGTTGQVLSTDGSGVLSWASAPPSTSLANGTSNVSIPAASGAVYTSVNGVANMLAVTALGVNVAGYANILSDIIGSGNANITKNGIFNYGLPDSVTIAPSGIEIGANTRGTPGTPYVDFHSSIGSPNYDARISTTGGNATSGAGNLLIDAFVTTIGNTADTFDLTVANTANLGANGNITITGGTSGQVLTTDGSGVLSWSTPAAGGLANGTSNVSIPAVNGNVNTSVAGNANVFVVTGTGANVTGTANVTGDILGGGNANITANVNAGNANITANLTAANANITATTKVFDIAVSNTANLGANSNVTITGGTSGQVLTTDGSGVLSWSTVGAGSLANGTSSVTIPVADGNVNTTVGGVANVFVVTTTGANLAGTANLTGNIIVGGNANITGDANIAGNAFITGDANVSGNANITGDANVTGNVAITGTANITGNTTVANIAVTTKANLGANGNVIITGGTSGQVLTTDGSGVLSWSTPAAGGLSNGTSNVSIPAVNGNINTSVAGNANVFVVTGVGANVSGTFDASSDITTLGNIGAIGDANISGNIYVGANANLVGNTQLANVAVSGKSNLNAVGNVTITGGSVGQVLTTDGSGVLSWSDVPVGSGLANGNSNVSIPAANGPIFFSVGGVANVLYLSTVSANVDGSIHANANANIVGNLVVGTDANISGNFELQGNFFSAGSSANFNYDLRVGGNVTFPSAANITITGGTAGQVLTATDNLGNLDWATLPTASTLANGTSNVLIPVADGNVNTSVGGNANVLVVTDTGANVTGTANITGAVYSGNTVTAYGNGAVGFAVGNGAQNQVALGYYPDTGVAADMAIRDLSDVTSTMYFDVSTGSDANGSFTFRSSNLYTTLLDMSISEANFSVDVVANAGSYFRGDGGLLSNISTSVISNGTSNVAIPVADGNVNISAAGNANVFVVTGVGANITGRVNATDDIVTGGNANISGEIYIAGYNSHGGTGYQGIMTATNTDGAATNPNKYFRLDDVGSYEIVNSAYSETIFTLTDDGDLLVPGNISAANITASSGNFFIGDGGLLSNVTATTGNIAYDGTTIEIEAGSPEAIILVSPSGNGGAAYLQIPDDANTLAFDTKLVSNGSIALYAGAGTSAINMSDTGNITINSVIVIDPNANITAVNDLTATGTIIAANVGNSATFLIGDGYQISNLTIAAGTELVNGNSNVIVNANANVTVSSNGVANVVVITDSNAVFTGNVYSPKLISSGTNGLFMAGNLFASAGDITVDPLNDGTANGNVTVFGNLSVTGTLSYANISSSVTDNLVWIAANNAVSQAAASGGGLAVGPAGAYATFLYNSIANTWVSSLQIVGTGVNANGALSGATTGAFSGAVTAASFAGDGGNLSNITGANVTGTVASATVAASANSVAGANVTGAVTLATTANNIAGGTAGALPYQTAANTTAMLAAGAAGSLLTSQGPGVAPTWATAVASRAYMFAINSSTSFAAILTATSVVDRDGAIYTIDNPNTTAYTLSFASILNPLMWGKGLVTGTNTVTLPPNTSLTFQTFVANTSYVLMAYSGSSMQGAAGQVASQGNPPINTDTGLNLSSVSGQDPNGWFTSNQFKPTIPGYYLITMQTSVGTGASNGQFNTQIRKNGTNVSLALAPIMTYSGSTATATATVYLNGTTDYVTATIYPGVTVSIQTGTQTQMTCVLIK